MPLLSILVPHMPQGFIERFFAELGAESGKSDVRVISRGYAHVASKHRLRYAGFHPDPYGEGEKEGGASVPSGWCSQPAARTSGTG